MIWKRKPPKDDMTQSGTEEPPQEGETDKRPSFEEFMGLDDAEEEKPKPSEQAPQEQQAEILPFPSEGEEEDPEASPHAYGRYRSTAGGHGVEFFLPSGEVYALPYSQIVMISTNEKADSLTIQCLFNALFIVSGKNLAPVREALLRQRAAFLKAPAQGPDDVSIQNITVEKPSREE